VRADGIAIFDALHRRGTVTEAMLYAFDLLELGGVDYRPLPLGKRKERLARLVDRRLTGILMNEHTDDGGELVFQQACRMGLEGIVSKRLSKSYQSGRSGHWLKIKNPDSPAMIRAPDHFAGRGHDWPPLSATLARRQDRWRLRRP
jgi:ATP-dependent DNA ligase